MPPKRRATQSVLDVVSPGSSAAPHAPRRRAVDSRKRAQPPSPASAAAAAPAASAASASAAVSRECWWDGVFAQYAERSVELTRLLSVLGLDAAYYGLPCPCGAVLVTGPSGSGKTACVQALARASGTPHAIVDCGELISPQHLYESVLDQLTGHVPTPANDFRSVVRCESSDAFVQRMRELCSGARMCVLLVMDNAEALLRHRPSHALRGLLPVLVRAGELCDCANLCTVFVSRQPLARFERDFASAAVLQVPFAQYSTEQLHAILMRGAHAGEPHYDAFVRYLLRVVGHACDDVQQLRSLVRLLYPLFAQPVAVAAAAAEAGAGATGSEAQASLEQLVQRIQPVVRNVLQSVYTRRTFSAPSIASALPEVGQRGAGAGAGAGSAAAAAAAAAPCSSGEAQHAQSRLFSADWVPDGAALARADTLAATAAAAAAARDGRAATSGVDADVELPRRAKIALIAAFLASYNPANLDAKLFSSSRPAANRSAKAHSEAWMRGPRAFPLARMLAIISSVTDEPAAANDYCAHAATLCAMGLLRVASNPKTLDDVKLRCVAPRAFVDRVARQVGVALQQYLSTTAAW